MNASNIMAHTKNAASNFSEIFNETVAKILAHKTVTISEYTHSYSFSVTFWSGLKTTGAMTYDGESEERFQELCESLRAIVRNFVTAEAEKLAAIVEDEDRLRHYREVWEGIPFSAGVIHRLMQLNTQKEMSIWKARNFDVYRICLVIWKEEMIVKRNHVLSAAVNLVNRVRDGESGLDVSLIKVLVALDEPLKKPKDINAMEWEEKGSRETYRMYFQEELLVQTRYYYIKEAAKVSEDGDIVSFMRKADERMAQEAERSRRYLHDDSTYEKLQKVVESAYIEGRLEVFQVEFRKFLVAERLSDLNLIYRLCSRVEKARTQLKEDFRDYVAEKCREAITNIPAADQSDPNTYISTVLGVHERFRALTETAFAGSANFMDGLQKGCVLVVNENKTPGKTSEILVRFIDLAMRKGGSDDFERTADEAMDFFMLIEDKDLFLKYYNRFLGKRLLMDVSTSEDAENSMLSRLKNAYGQQCTAATVQMFQDVEVSKRLSADFRQAHKTGFEVNYQILSTGSWNFRQGSEFCLPMELQNAVDAFSAYYQGVHQGKKLIFLSSISRGELSATCFTRKYTFLATTAQMAVLLKYNDDTRLSLAQLQDSLEMQEDLLGSVLASLVKANILKKTEDDEDYELNSKFSYKRMKVDLQKLQMSTKDGREAAKKEQKDLERALDEERLLVLQAAIVRIMKMRRRVQHNALITEVVEQVSQRFQPRISMIKMCIDLLMEKQYMQRNQADRDTYEYIS